MIAQLLSSVLHLIPSCATQEFWVLQDSVTGIRLRSAGPCDLGSESIWSYRERLWLRLWSSVQSDSTWPTTCRPAQLPGALRDSQRIRSIYGHGMACSLSWFLFYPTKPKTNNLLQWFVFWGSQECYIPIFFDTGINHKRWTRVYFFSFQSPESTSVLGPTVSFRKSRVKTRYRPLLLS